MASASLRRQGARWRWFSVWFSASTMPPERLRPTADHVALTQSELREFELFFQHYQHRLFGYLWRVTGEEQTAYDLSQETFVRAWQHFRTIKSYEGRAILRMLLCEVAAIPGEDEEFERCPQ